MFRISVLINLTSVPLVLFMVYVNWWGLHSAHYYEATPVKVISINNQCPSEGFIFENGPDGSLMPAVFTGQLRRMTTLFFTQRIPRNSPLALHTKEVYSRDATRIQGIAFDGRIRTLDQNFISQSEEEGKIEVYLGFRKPFLFLRDTRERTPFRKYVVYIKKDCDLKKYNIPETA